MGLTELLKEGKVLAESGKFELAITCFREVFKQELDVADRVLTSRLIGLTLFKAKKYSAAELAFGDLLEVYQREDLDKGDIRLRRWSYWDDKSALGFSLLELEKYNEAADIFDYVIKSYSDHPSAWYGLGEAYCGLWRQTKSPEWLSSAIDSFEMAVKKGLIFVGGDDSCLVCSDKMEFVDDAIIKSYKRLAEIYKNKNRFFKAVSAAFRAWIYEKRFEH